MPTYTETGLGGGICAGTPNITSHEAFSVSGGSLAAGAHVGSITPTAYRLAFSQLKQGDIRYFLKPDGSYERRSTVRVTNPADHPILETNKGDVTIYDITLTPSEYASRLKIILDNESTEVDRNILNSLA